MNPDKLEIVNLSELAKRDTRDPGFFGGKAAGLASLIRNGARVPDGFVVEPTCAVVEQWLEISREFFLERVRALLKRGPVAVRSSAPVEDSPERSYAGIFETVLNCSTEEEVLVAASRCVASGQSPRAQVYESQSDPIPVGILVQCMVEAEVAGVCFTRDPRGTDRACVVEAVQGGGDSLVSGKILPDRWRIYQNGFGEAEILSEENAHFLTGDQIHSLYQDAMDLTRHAGYDLDLEWAIDHSGNLWWLQARPITVSMKQQETYRVERSCPEAADGPVTVWSNWNVRETMPEPLHPLTWDLWRRSILPTVTEHLSGVQKTSPVFPHLAGLDRVEGRIYFNMNAALAAPIIGWIMERILFTMDPEHGKRIQPLISKGILKPRNLPGHSIQRLPGLLLASLKGSARFLLAVRPGKAMNSLVSDSRTIQSRPAISGLSSEELLEEIYLWEKPGTRRILLGLQMEGLAIGMFQLARYLFRDHPEALHLLATGITANPTTQISLAIDDLIHEARPMKDRFLDHSTWQDLESSLQQVNDGKRWLTCFHDFLQTNGFRGPGEFDLFSPRWIEDPDMILSLIRTGLACEPGETVRDRMVRLGIRRKKAVDTAIQASPFWKRPLLRISADLVNRFMPLREAPKHYGMVVFQRIRQAALELGKRGVDRGWMSKPDEVFFLSLRELEIMAREEKPREDIQQRILERRNLFTEQRMIHPPDILRSDGVPVPGPKIEREGRLTGIAVSPGSVTGPARILSDPDPEKLKEGDILVVGFADPGWTPLFPRAAALVVEVGGLMCHAAVVARELGVPAVFSVPGALARITEGQVIQVNGTEGWVEIESGGPAGTV
ncbi:MAG TPA: PEP/pyruvate-binding domain-containing protein [Thermoanaerobaculia bacterium]|nr:PEP/pyruvate-binding domain-containing protein [Thermoanaerobaculia bacterium]HUM30043.1 PEP/pyruvate-binding domain-containing protein [Thermoanaerobaculia bacterium]HXK68268.1 PEP/pyruvate-binding domain-containing protein [Thermoanaerobaculia bacterium]